MALKSSNKVDTNVYEIEVTVAPEEFTQACKDAYLKRRKSIQLPGFRKGKATQGMIEKLYGEGFFYEDALEIVYPAVVTAAIEEAGLRTVDSPAELDVKTISKSEGVDMTMKVTVYPEVKLGQYKGLEAVQLPTEADDEDVANELTNMLDRNSRLVTVEDRAAEMGDTAEIDFEGFVDGVAFDGGKGENYPLELGSGSFIPGFEEQVAGHKTEEAFDVNVTFPEEYQAENLAGKDAVFKVKIHEIKTKEVPALDDEFAKDVSEFDTLAEFKDDLKQKIIDRNMAQSEAKFRQALLGQLCDQIDIELPEAMVNAQIDSLMNNYAARLEQQGISLEMYLQYMQMDMDKLRSDLKEPAEMQIKQQLALDAVVAAEGITVSDEDMDEEIKKAAANLNVPYERVIEGLDKNGLKVDLARDRAMAAVAAEAKPHLITADEESGEIKVTEVTKDEPAEEKAEEKPKKTTRKKKTEETADGEEKKPAAKKTRAKKTTEEGEEAPKKTTRKKKAEEPKGEE